MKNEQRLEVYLRPDIEVVEINLSTDFFAGSGNVAGELGTVEGVYW